MENPSSKSGQAGEESYDSLHLQNTHQRFLHKGDGELIAGSLNGEHHCDLEDHEEQFHKLLLEYEPFCMHLYLPLPRDRLLQKK